MEAYSASPHNQCISEISAQNIAIVKGPGGLTGVPPGLELLAFYDINFPPVSCAQNCAHPSLVRLWIRCTG
jgi:hypothetical protein